MNPYRNAPQVEEIASLIDEDELTHSLQDYMQLQQLYNAAIRQIRTKLEILNDEFQVNYARNPIHHIDCRLKSTRSIVNKLKKRNLEVSLRSARENLSDIAGIRVVCCYIEDCYKVRDMLLRQNDIRLVKMKDYIKEPDCHGYRSLHLDMEVPVYLSDSTEHIVTEIQIRTVAMDFWASLEHDMRYKCDLDVPKSLTDHMITCADRIAEIDREMQEMFHQIMEQDSRVKPEGTAERVTPLMQLCNPQEPPQSVTDGKKP